DAGRSPTARIHDRSRWTPPLSPTAVAVPASCIQDENHASFSAGNPANNCECLYVDGAALYATSPASPWKLQLEHAGPSLPSFDGSRTLTAMSTTPAV